MSKIWFFGDSFTDTNINIVEFRKKYDDYMGYKTRHFTDLLSEKLGIDFVNLGLGGRDNETIFEKIIDNIQEIDGDDIIIINWSTTSRFRLTSMSGDPVTLLCNMKNYNIDISDDCMDQIFTNRTTDLFVNQILKWCKLLKYTFKNNKILFWSPFTEFKNTEVITIMTPPNDFLIDFEKFKKLGIIFDDDNQMVNFHFLNIKGQTDGKVDDSHYSEIGNHLIFDLLFHELKKIL